MAADSSSDDIATAILTLEQAALDRWCNGDPSGFLAITAPDVTYFDPFLGRRLDGFEALAAYYEGLRGKVFASGWKLVDPRVQPFGDVAVLTFGFHSWGASGEGRRWHCTEVYRRLEAGWRIVQTHWSFAAAGCGPVPVGT